MHGKRKLRAAGVTTPLAALILGGCASVRSDLGARRYVQTFVVKSIHWVYAELGPPTRTLPVRNGGRYLWSKDMHDPTPLMCRGGSRSEFVDESQGGNGVAGEPVYQDTPIYQQGVVTSKCVISINADNDGIVVGAEIGGLYCKKLFPGADLRCQKADCAWNANCGCGFYPREGCIAQRC